MCRLRGYFRTLAGAQTHLNHCPEPVRHAPKIVEASVNCFSATSGHRILHYIIRITCRTCSSRGGCIVHSGACVRRLCVCVVAAWTLHGVGSHAHGGNDEFLMAHRRNHRFSCRCCCRAPNTTESLPHVTCTPPPTTARWSPVTRRRVRAVSLSLVHAIYVFNMGVICSRSRWLANWLAGVFTGCRGSQINAARNYDHASGEYGTRWWPPAHFR